MYIKSFVFLLLNSLAWQDFAREGGGGGGRSDRVGGRQGNGSGRKLRTWKR